MNKDFMKDEREDNAKIKRVELHAHTKMSKRDAVVSARELIMTATNWGWDAIAITDHGVVQAFPEAMNTVILEKLDIKIIYGMEGYLTDEGYQLGRAQYAHSPVRHVTLLAKNKEGLHNLYRLVSISHLYYFSRRPRIPKNILQEYREGLLIGSACEAGELIRAIAMNENEEKLIEIANFYDFLEIQPIKNNVFLLENDQFPNINTEEDLRNINRKVAELSVKLNKPLVATCDAHSLNPINALCRNIIKEQMCYQNWNMEDSAYLRTTDEMLKEFGYLGENLAYEAVVTNTHKIADMVERLKPLPDCLYAKTIPNSDDEIKKIIDKNIHRLYGEHIPKIVKNRFDKELSYILSNGFSAFYLASYQIVKKAKYENYLTGYQGLIGASFIAFVMGITEINPLPPHWRCPKCQHSEFALGGKYIGFDLPDKKCPKCGEMLVKEGYDIPFEFFAGIDEKKLPDIDLNFSASHRYDICKYMTELYGESKVLGATDIVKYHERQFYSYLNNSMTHLSEIYPFMKKTLKLRGQELNENSLRYFGETYEGIKRQSVLRPNNIMLIPQDIPNNRITPIQDAENVWENRVATHFDYQDLYTRLVNLDICENDGLTFLEALQELSNFPADHIPFNDSKVLLLFNSVESLGISADDLVENTGLLGIPSFEGFFVRQIIQCVKPNCFNDLVKILGFYKGIDVWLGNAQDLICNGICSAYDTIGAREDIVTYLQKNGVDSSLSLIIANNVSNGKGISKEIEEKLKAVNISNWYIKSCQKIKRLVSRSEIVADAVLAYRCAYYKLHYPLAFYTAYFSIKKKRNDVNVIFKGKDEVRRELKHLFEIETRLRRENEKMFILQVALEMYLRGYELSPSDVYCDKKESTDLKDFVNRMNNLSFK